VIHRIFAISAEGFDTVGFGDGAAMRAEDAGLLGWVTGCVSIVDRESGERVLSCHITGLENRHVGLAHAQIQFSEHVFSGLTI
jgi:hypothetical protein